MTGEAIQQQELQNRRLQYLGDWLWNGSGHGQPIHPKCPRQASQKAQNRSKLQVFKAAP